MDKCPKFCGGYCGSDFATYVQSVTFRGGKWKAEHGDQWGLYKWTPDAWVLVAGGLESFAAVAAIYKREGPQEQYSAGGNPE